jgi:hypothetical protein
VDKAWLTTKITAAEFELEFLRANLGPPTKSPLSTQSAWRAFRDQLREGDTLWRWSSPPFPARFSGEEGIALVREGNIIAHLTTNAWRARM